MRSCLLIARHEWRRLFAAPLAWICLSIVQLLAGMVFWLLLAEFASTGHQNQNLGVAEFVGGGLFGFCSIIFLLVVPLLAMRSFAEERENGSLDLYLSSPVSNASLVLGKFFGLLALLGLMLGLICLMPLSLLRGTSLDLGLLFSGALGLGLMLAAFAAVSLFISLLCQQAIVAAVASFGLLLMLWLLQVAGTGDSTAGRLADYLSILSHFDALRRGVFDSADVAYYLLFCIGFLGLGVQRLNWEQNA
ncbi:MAG: ABC transporter permease [Oceanococcus sp.]